MRYSWISVVILAVSTMAVRAADVPSTSPADEPVRAALRKLIPMYEQSVSTDNIDPDKDNLDALRPYLAPDFSAVMVTSRPVNNFDELRAFWKDMRTNYIGKGGKYKVTVNPQPSIIQGDIAITRGTADEYAMNSRGMEFRYQSQWTAVFRKDPAAAATDPAGQWRIVRLHASMDPVYNDFTNLTTRVWRWVAIAAGVVAAILAVVVVLMLRRRKAPASEVGRV